MVGLHPLKPVSAPLGVIAAGVSGVVVLGPCIGATHWTSPEPMTVPKIPDFLQHTGFDGNIGGRKP